MSRFTLESVTTLPISHVFFPHVTLITHPCFSFHFDLHHCLISGFCGPHCPAFVDVECVSAVFAIILFVDCMFLPLDSPKNRKSYYD